MAGASAMLLNLDSSFRIELAWVAGGAHRALEEAIHKKVIACFPNKEITVSLAQCEARLHALTNSTMYKCATRASQSAVQTIRSVIGKMTRGISPAESIKTGGGLFSQVWTHMQFFVKHTPSSGSKKGQELHGQDALCAKLQELEAIVAKESRTAQLHELDVFKVTHNIHHTHKTTTQMHAGSHCSVKGCWFQLWHIHLAGYIAWCSGLQVVGASS